MDLMKLAEEIIGGRRLTREDDLSFFLTCDLEELCKGADRLREYFIGDKVDLCSIINGRSGRCPEDCKYCAQSAHNHTNCEIYDFLPEEKIVEACKLNESEGVDRFSIVTAGRALLTNDGEIVHGVRQRLVARLVALYNLAAALADDDYVVVFVDYDLF